MEKTVQYMGFIYGGKLKSDNIYIFISKDVDPITYCKENLIQKFGYDINGRFIKCKDANKALKKFFTLVNEKCIISDIECKNILKCDINAASELLKIVGNNH